MFEQAFKNIDDVLWKDTGCTGELDCTEQTSWLLFLKYLDVLELYATAIDYDPQSEGSLQFFKIVQNKLHYAAHGHTDLPAC